MTTLDNAMSSRSPAAAWDSATFDTICSGGKKKPYRATEGEISQGTVLLLCGRSVNIERGLLNCGNSLLTRKPNVSRVFNFCLCWGPGQDAERPRRCSSLLTGRPGILCRDVRGFADSCREPRTNTGGPPLIVLCEDSRAGPAQKTRAARVSNSAAQASCSLNIDRTALHCSEVLSVHSFFFFFLQPYK